MTFVQNSNALVYSSPLGPIQMILDPKGRLLALQFLKNKSHFKNQKTQFKVKNKIFKWLDQYFSGQNPIFLDFNDFSLEGTIFQKKVWKELFRIPYGQTISYAELAKRIRHPKAMRAVGNANGRNPLPILIPCHRVIASDGSLGGYSSGLAIKKRLLDLEGYEFPR